MDCIMLEDLMENRAALVLECTNFMLCFIS